MCRKIKILGVFVLLFCLVILSSCGNAELNVDVENLDLENNNTDIALAVDYERLVVTEKEHTEAFVYGEANYANIIEMPKIAFENENTSVINSQIASLYEQYENCEDAGCFVLTYSYNVTDKVLALMLDFDLWYFEKTPQKQYHFFYYDPENDVILTFDEYLNHFGIDKEILAENTARNNDFATNYEGELTLALMDAMYGGVYSDEESFAVAYRGLSNSGDNIVGISTQKSKEIFAKVNTNEGSTLNLRSLPSTDQTSTVIATMPSGASLKIISGAYDEWAYVEYERYKGYVSTKYIKIEE